MNILLAFLLTIGTSTPSTAQVELKLTMQAEIWSDETLNYGVSKRVSGPAKDEQTVRAQLAGITDSFTNPSVLFAPDDVHFGKFRGYPSCSFRGVSFARKSKSAYSVTVIFTTKHTIAVFCHAPEGATVPSAEAFVHFTEEEPSQVTEQAFSFIEARWKSFLPEFQSTVRQLAAAYQAKPETGAK